MDFKAIAISMSVSDMTDLKRYNPIYIFLKLKL